MSRSTLAFLALAMLLGLTLATWGLADRQAANWTLALVAVLKVGVIGAVFLELDRAWLGWALLLVLLSLGIAGGAAVLMGA